MIKLLGYTVAVAAVLVLILCLPYALVWAINVFGETLWPERVIPYTLDTWAAACIITGLFAGGINSRRR
jgi:hypothetical protein